MKAIHLTAILVLAFGLSTCKTPAGSVSTIAPKDVSEIMPGILQGYLDDSEMPNSFSLLPPPPDENSVAFALDQEHAKKALEQKDSARIRQAERDANLNFPYAINNFQQSVGISITQTGTPNLFRMMRRILTDAAMSTSNAKNYYNRRRPFIVNNTPTCIPSDEQALRNDGSYPSGHTAIGWAWALVLCEIFPDRADAILKRGIAFGESRIICNVHWYSDVEMGRVMGAAVVACLHANSDFGIDLAAAKAEVKK